MTRTPAAFADEGEEALALALEEHLDRPVRFHEGRLPSGRARRSSHGPGTGQVRSRGATSHFGRPFPLVIPSARRSVPFGIQRLSACRLVIPRLSPVRHPRSPPASARHPEEPRRAMRRGTASLLVCTFAKTPPRSTSSGAALRDAPGERVRRARRVVTSSAKPGQGPAPTSPSRSPGRAGLSTSWLSTPVSAWAKSGSGATGASRSTCSAVALRACGAERAAPGSRRRAAGAFPDLRRPDPGGARMPHEVRRTEVRRRLLYRPM